ncbi:MAG TPA: hypothetical protein VLF67_04930 [Candidatus Saccharimonas sp.]|nr:hypothetical protein [Candidatus Saccharimonas sp.]
MTGASTTQPAKADWTVDPGRGLAFSSALFEQVVTAVAHDIKAVCGTGLPGVTYTRAARAVVEMLVRQYGLAPAGETAQPVITADWTVDPESGRSNSSERFRDLEQAVTALIVGDAHKLIAGRARDTAGLILAQLAHKHGLVPADHVGPQFTSVKLHEDDGSLSGLISVGDQLYHFTAVPCMVYVKPDQPA